MFALLSVLFVSPRGPHFEESRCGRRKGEWRLLISLGVLFVIQMGTLNIGFDLTKGSIAAILISTNPLFAAFAAHFIIVDDRLSFRKAVGLMIAFGGVAIVLLGGFSLES